MDEKDLIIATYQQLLANATHQYVASEAKIQGLERANAVLQAKLDEASQDTDDLTANA